MMDLSEYKIDIAFQITENWEDWKIHTDKIKDAFSELTDGEINFEFHSQHTAGNDDDAHCHESDSSKHD